MQEKKEPITVESIVDAPIEKVWACFTEPAHITQWSHASDDWHSPSAENDLRVGGSFKTRMEAKDGSAGFDFTGVYDTVDEYARIAYTMSDGRKVEVKFEQAADGVHIITTFDPESENPIEMQKEGWQAILDNFQAHVASH